MFIHLFAHKTEIYTDSGVSVICSYELIILALHFIGWVNQAKAGCILVTVLVISVFTPRHYYHLLSFFSFSSYNSLPF